MLLPFSQKFILRKGSLPDQTGAPLRLLIDSDLSWHWSVRNDAFFTQVREKYENLVNDKGSLYSENSPCIVENQEIEIDFSRLKKKKEKTRKDLPQKKSENCDSFRMEHLAWYSPAHSHPSGYGIHLTYFGVAKLAKGIESICAKENLDIIQLAAAYKLFAHELCHSWIEDICTIIDFSEGIDYSNIESQSKENEKEESRYSKTQKKYNGYIFLEELICNTAAYGWLGHFLRNSASEQDPPIPRFNADKIIDAFAVWIRNAPPGYKDFVEIKSPPHLNKFFVKAVGLLLSDTDTYDYDLDKVRDALQLFFDVRISPNFDHVIPRHSNRWDSMWIGRPPLHVPQN